MKTIEERAIDYASHSYIEDGNINTYIDESEKQSYIQGATEQKDIDIENACKACENELRRLKTLLKRGFSVNIISVGKSLSNIRKEM